MTLGYGPVEEGNFPKHYDMMVFLDRASTNAAVNRSAYMEEIHRIQEMLKQCIGKTPLIYIDEPFSTTAPSDQSAMIELLIKKVMTLGGDIVIATHNEEAMKSLGEKYGDTVGYYHYDYTLDRNPDGRLEIQTHHSLLLGIADAQSIEVAEMNGAPADFLRSARAFLDGSLSLSSREKTQFREIEAYSDIERETIAKNPS